MKKLWLCYRGPYDCSAWAKLMTKEDVLDFFSQNDDVKPVLDKHPQFEKLRVESHRGEADEDGRVYIWGEDEASTEGPDTQHEGILVYLDDKLVYSDCRFVDTEDEDHESEECDLCKKPLA